MIEITGDQIFLFNIALILLLLWKLYRSYRSGFFSQIVHLSFSFVGFFLVLLLMPMLGSIRIMPTEWNVVADIPFLNEMVYQILNQCLWWVIIIFGFSVLRMIIVPLVSPLKKIVVIGKLDQIGGLLLGVVNCFVTIGLLSFITTLPLVKNGSQVRQETILSWGDAFHGIIKIGFPKELHQTTALLEMFSQKPTSQTDPHQLLKMKKVLIDYGISPQQVEKIIEAYVRP